MRSRRPGPADAEAPSDIKALDRKGLAAALAELGEPSYRTEQVLRWLYQRRIRGFDEMTDLPRPLRGALDDRFTIGRLHTEVCETSRDATRKYLFRLTDGATVESVGMPGARGRLTVCYSTQAGCAMGCLFCATGVGGFVRNLSVGEMVDQVAEVGADFGRRVSNAVAMGQGEPFANYDATLGALRLLNDEDALGIGARHLTVSTCGIVPGLRRFAEEPEQFTLAVSLHSAIQSTRDRLMPAMAAYPLSDLKAALGAYVDRTGRRPSLEYALIADINDSPVELAALVAFCQGLLCHVNLIHLNPAEGVAVARASAERLRAFERELAEAGIETSVRRERGSDISAACGQLRQSAPSG